MARYCSITATFEVGSDVNKAVIDVNNRIAIALPRLPDDVRRNGVVAQKRSTDILFVVAVSSDDPRYDTLFLSNYALVNILDELKRVWSAWLGNLDGVHGTWDGRHASRIRPGGCYPVAGEDL